MDASKLVRDTALIKENFIEKDGAIITKQDCSIIIPYSFLQHNLAFTGTRIEIVSVFAIVIGNSYGSMCTCARLVITPAETNQIKLFGEDSLEFVFPAGSIVTTTNIVKDADLAIAVHKNCFAHGRVPWFLNYDEVGLLLKDHQEYGGFYISPDNIPFELLASRICRSPTDSFKHYRFTDFSKPPVCVPFNSVLFNATNTTAKILGNYLDDGFTSALLSPSEHVETVETLLRS